MISPEQLQANFNNAIAHAGEYRCRVDLNLYDSPSCTCLATQAAVGRHLQLLSKTLVDDALEVRLSEDGYSGWLAVQDLTELEYAATPYQAVAFSPAQIQERLSTVIAFTKAAMQQPNYYLWGGTVGPNYDCSGLMQAAFAASGIWLPRDSYQQEAFTQKIEISQLLAGDLVFFAKAEKVSHVGLYLGDGYYIHSSGKDTGRNGIAIDRLLEEGDEIAHSYYRQFKGAGRVVESYQPPTHPERQS
ncbi:MAG: C40 family peptidase [Coleofasciculus sp. C3-bin4]|nr:C40 family peptidase [Coleofasciculus sp. C3-bin4]